MLFHLEGIIMDQKPITRRESIKKIIKISGGFTLGTLAFSSGSIPLPVRAESKKNGFIVEGIGQTDGYDVQSLVRQVFDAAGGIKTFISKGDIVLIKPNLSWAYPPHFAATTNPDVLETVIVLCQEAGAKKVRIADNTIQNAGRCFATSGANAIAHKTGAELIVPRDSLMRDMEIKGQRLKSWPVFKPVVETDKIINLPVAKTHNHSGLTLGMKNWIGAVGGQRGALHQDIHQVIVDLARFFKPTLTLVDAIRIMVSNGPSGGRQSDVAMKNRLILSNDQVAADALATTYFDIQKDKVAFIPLAEKAGIGTSDLSRLENKKVML
jgi:uncharacterized protein (DUF362 family)